MHSSRFLSFMMVALLVLSAVAAGQGPWDAKTRTISLAGPDAKPRLTRGVARFVLADGQSINTDGKRYKVTTAELLDRTVIRGADSTNVLDWEMVIRRIDPASVRIDLTIVNRSEKPLTLERIEVLDATLAGRIDPQRNRAIVNGHNSWSGGRVVGIEEGKKLESHYTLTLQSPALAAGFLAGRHNLNRFRLTPEGKVLKLLAWGDCDQCILPAGATRSTDPLFVSFGHPLAGMERFADLAARENGVQLWPENFATWCSWYAGWIRQEPLYEYKGGLEKGAETNILHVARHMAGRGGGSMRVVDDSYDMPYGDWDNKTLAITKGFDRLAKLMAAKDIRAGVWYPPFWVATRTRTFQKRQDLLCRDEEGKVYVETRGIGAVYGNHLGYLDASNPAAARQIEQTARAWRDRGYRYVMTDFLMWGAWKKKRHDPTLTSVETYNRGLAAMRRGYGKDTYWLHCGALLGPAMGLCDGMRISGDSHGAGTYSYIAAGARWFYNGRVWLNDPDAIVCVRHGEAKSVAWNRAWMSWMALAGCVLTYGDSLDTLPAEQMAVYEQVLPPLNRPGRPLDIFENSPFVVWGADGGEPERPCALLGVFELQGRGGGRKVTLNLDEAVARAQGWTGRPDTVPARRLVWDFWQRKLTIVDGPELTLDMPDKSCHVLSVRPDLGRPQLVGTTGHISQGGLEVRDMVWKRGRRENRLIGRVRGNGGDGTMLYFHVPEGVTCTGVSVNYATPKIFRPARGVLGVLVPAVNGGATQTVPFELTFTGQAEKPKTRPFKPGNVATITEK